MTLVSRMLGFIRDALIAQFFGSGMEADAFFVAFRIPNFFRRLFVEGSFAQVLIPTLSRYKNECSIAKRDNFISKLLGNTICYALLLTVVGMLMAPGLTYLFVPGYSLSPERYSLTVHLLQVVFPFVFFVSLTALFAAILNTYGHFFAPSFAPVLLNVTIILATIYASGYFDRPIEALAWGVTVGGLLQLLSHLPYLVRLRLLPPVVIQLKDTEVKRVFSAMLPAIFGVSVTQINLFLDTLLASFLETGSISWLYYSERLVELPLGVFGIAITSVILPQLSEKFQEKRHVDFSVLLEWSLRMTALFAVPATLALIILAKPILITLFQYGDFTDRDVTKTAESLSAYAVGIVPFILIKIFASGLYAQLDTQTPVQGGWRAMFCNLLLSLCLVLPLGHAGLALATSLSSVANSWYLAHSLKTKGCLTVSRRTVVHVGRILSASLTMGCFLLICLKEFDISAAYSVSQKMMGLSLLIAGGILVYFMVLWLTGFRLRDINVPQSTL